MPKKFTGANSKVTAAAEKKAAAQAEKDSKARKEKETQVAGSWREGAKDMTKQKEADAKRAEKEARRREAQLQLEAETKEIARSQAAKTAPPKLAPKKKPAATTPSFDDAPSAPAPIVVQSDEPVESFAAHNIDDALDLIQAVAAPDDDKAPVSRHAPTAALIDRHPERRARAAYHIYEEREIDRLKTENPGLRLTQIKDLIYKAWQKSPENPLNQSQVAHNASQDEVKAVIKSQKKALKDRLRV
ncbi:hypothetical protein GGH94_006140 [Coemansia aciculifera]|uniref:DUF1014-domain-containing protein n=1 Tax=Coemansia aciculifera TaxID=417176 RepID=A0A9W8ICG0_9FUNG|nr:hypothetical protein GGH94_006140 [Coemansia aciculifera]KAJ2869551.1 hypothetical protein GGH93_006129 [Coemansia aciculifera]